MTRSDRTPRVPRIPRVRRARSQVSTDTGSAGSIELPPTRLASVPGRGAHALEVVQQPLPGHLFLDPDVPADEVLHLTCGAWTGRASHVWTGVGWARLLPGPVAVVPTARPRTG